MNEKKMSDSEEAYFRKMFKLQVHESIGNAYEALFTKIMGYANPDFKQVSPYGNIGDRKNDGWIPKENTFFQVYAPDNLGQRINPAVTKLKEDFKGLFDHWNCVNKIEKFFFVLNDKFNGCPPQLQTEIEKIRTNNKYKLVDAKIFTASDLEAVLFNLSKAQIISILGQLPNIVDDKKEFEHDRNKYQEFSFLIKLKFIREMLDRIKSQRFILSSQDSDLHDIQSFLKQPENLFFSANLNDKMATLHSALLEFAVFRGDHFELQRGLKEQSNDPAYFLCPELREHYYEDKEKQERFKEKQKEMISKIEVIEKTIIEIIEIAKNELGL